MLEVRLRHRFGRGTGPRAAMDDGFALDVAFAGGPGVTALFGPSGCGKSTILSAIAGLLRPQEGRIALDGTALFDGAARCSVPPEARRCAMVFQDARLFPHLSVGTNLRYGLRRAPRDARGPGFAEVVDLLGIGHLLGRRPRTLSGGERQRVALGRALLARPRLLLMDEPLAALDAARRAEVLPFLARLRDAARLPILYVTHALDEVDALADDLVMIQAGRVLAAGPVEAIAARTDLPLAARRDAGVVLRAEIAAHEPARGLTRVALGGATLLLPQRPEPPGTRIRLRLRARDVAVALRPPDAVSIDNVLPCRLVAIEPAAEPAEVFLRLDLGGAVLLSRVLRGAVDRLGLAPGQPLFALVKSIAFDHAPSGAAP
ncbi:MAG TPA: molybdenum ABC transporter ATP-binding protein [Acetobacteraceae bacterium]|nr:molybdenum ABC transporter ATP-binding protein [Acetobacteraceae bacterium]